VHHENFDLKISPLRKEYFTFSITTLSFVEPKTSLFYVWSDGLEDN